jgi:ABC-type nitrate/sulfonate/bicarbonate transport system permease component
MRVIRALAFPAAALLLCELALLGVVSDTLAPPSAAVWALVAAFADGTLIHATAQTMWSVVAGLGLGFGMGVVCGLMLGFSRIASELTRPAIEVVRPLPSVALIPLALLIYGFGYRMEVLIIAFAVFWPTIILTQAGTAQIDPRLLEVSRVLRFGALARLTKIILPSAMPRLFVAFRIASGLALVVAVTVEIAANPQGMGHALMAAQQALRPDLMLAMLLWTGILGWSINSLLLLAEKWLFPAQSRSGASAA